MAYDPLKEFWQVVGNYGFEHSDSQLLSSLLTRPLQRQAVQEDIASGIREAAYDVAGSIQLFPSEDDLQTTAASMVFNNRIATIGEKMALQTPEGVVYLTFKNDNEALSRATNMAFEYLNQIYGDEYLTSFLQASLLKNPDNFNASVEVLNQLLNQPVQPFSLGGGQHQGSTELLTPREGSGLASGSTFYDVTPDTIMGLIEDPSKYQELSPAAQRSVRGYVSGLVEKLDESGLASVDNAQSTLEKITAVLVTGKARIALTQAEIEKLRSIPQLVEGEDKTQFNITNAGAPGELVIEELAPLGITSLSGREGGTYRLDEKWARENPVKAVAVIRKMQELYPDARFDIGGSGIIGDVFDVLGMPVDVVGGAVGAGAHQLNELGERLLVDEGARNKAEAELTKLRTQLANGKIPEEDIDEALRRIHHLEDITEDAVGLQGALGDVEQAITGRAAGAGFADPLLETADYFPGDPGYDAVHAVTTLVGSFAIDPLVWGSNVLRGSRLARTVPRGTETVAKLSNSVIAQGVYRMFAKTPEQFLATRAGQKAVDRLWDAKTTLGDQVFATRVMDNIGLDSTGTNLLLSAKSREDMQLALFTVMTGPGEKLHEIDAVMTRMGQVGRELDDLRSIPSKVQELKKHVATLKGQITRTRRRGTEAGSIEYDTVALGPGGRQFRGNQPLTTEDVAELRLRWTEYTDFDEAAMRASLESSGLPPEQVEEMLMSVREAVAYDLDQWDTFFTDLAQEVNLAQIAPGQNPGYTWEDIRQFFDEQTGEAAARLDGAIPDNFYPMSQSGESFVDDILPLMDEQFRPFDELPATPQLLYGRNLSDGSVMVSDNQAFADADVLAAGARQDEAGVVIPRQGYLKLNNPFDEDTVYDPETYGAINQALLDRGISATIHVGPATGDEIMNFLFGVLNNPNIPGVAQMGDMTLNGRVRAVLSDAGFDGMITKVPGPTANDPITNLYIAFDQNALVDNLDDLPIKMNPAMEARIQELTEQINRDTLDIQDLNRRKENLRDREIDLAGEYAFLKTVVDGREVTRPLIGLPSSGQLKRILPEGPFEKAWLTATELVERFPANLFDAAGVKNMANYLFATKEGRELERTSREFFVRMEHWIRHAGAGKTIVFPSTTLSGTVVRRLDGTEVLIDAAQESYDELRNFYKLLGHNETKVDDLLSGWSDIGTSKANAYDWFVNSYTRAIAESPVLPASAKQELSDIWPELTGERSPGFLAHASGRRLDPQPTLYRRIPHPTQQGKYIESGVPVFTGDMLQTVNLPSFDQMREYVSFYRRLMDNWKQYGKVRKPIATGLLGLSHAWRKFNTFWKYSVLLARMPSALPARIVSEEMLRMAAFDYASAVRHPLEWLRSVRGVDEFELFAESPTGLLGVLTRQLDESNFFLARSGRQMVYVNDGQPFYNSMSGVLAKRFNSPEVKQLLNRNPKKFLEWAESPQGKATLGDSWLANIDNALDPAGIKTREEAITRMQRELKDLIGSGAGADKIRAALKTGRIKDPDGKVLEVGTKEFADELGRMAGAGEWTPGSTFLPRFHGDYLPVDRGTLAENMADARDAMFDLFYAKPDLYLSRSPLYRQVAKREMDKLIALGYSEEAAKEVARSRAARRTSDLMFTVGAATPAEFALRNLSPFFPAWRELATTWLYRIPKQYGGGRWALGSALFAHRVDLWTTFFKDIGLVQQNSSGEYILPLPGVGPMVQKFLGVDIPIQAQIPAESVFGLLPVPKVDEGGSVTGFLPTLGAPSTVVLGQLSDKFGGVFEDMEKSFTLFGADTSLGPAALDRALEAFGITPPWMTNTTQDLHEAMRNWAVIDGMQMAIADTPPPAAVDLANMTPQQRTRYVREWNEWAEEIVERGEKYATTTYLIRAVGGATLPFSVRFENERSDQLGALFKIVGDIPDETLQTPALEVFKSTYPGAWAFLTGKTIDRAPELGVDRQNFDAFVEEIKGGKIELLTPEEWLRFSYGMNSYFVKVNKTSQLFNQLGSTPRDVLLAGFERRQELDKINDEWENFLILSNQVAEDEGNGRSFETLFNLWQKSRSDEAGPKLSLDQEKALEAKRLLGEIGLSLSPNRPPAEFVRAAAVLSEVTSGVSYPRSTTPIGQGIDWWWTNVGNPYREEVDQIWKRINDTPRALRGPLYEELRQVENKWHTQYETKRFGSLPSPQEVFFNNLSPRDQRLRLMEQATLPVHFLNEFYREQLGFGGPAKKLNELASYVNTVERDLDVIVAREQIHTASREYEILKARAEQLKRQKAAELGVAKEYEEWQQPTFARLDKAMKLSEKSGSFMAVAGYARAIWDALERADLSPRGSSQAAQALQRSLVQKVESLRKQDSTFDDIMANLELALGEDGRPLVGPDMYMKVFFDYWTDSAPLYVFVE